MTQKKLGSQSFQFPSCPKIQAWASIAGQKESEGPLKEYYDVISKDSYFAQTSWEQGEQQMQLMALNKLSEKAKLSVHDFQIIFSGDLLNQCIGSSFILKNKNIPHLGLYGACSTMAESILLSAMTVDGGYADNVVAMTSSHFASSERQYRFPLNYGGQRPPTSQWTVTGSGAVLISLNGHGPRVIGCTVGTVVDLGIQDAGNMGAVMAPAAAATLKAHFNDFKRSPADYDLIVTGDLGQLGKELLIKLCLQSGYDIEEKLVDCGTLVFDQNQDVHCGGSGCGCSAIALCGYFLNSIQNKKYQRILFCGTGALLSPTANQQGLTIPGVCHAVIIEGE